MTPFFNDGENSDKSLGMNWKMTVKTILVQMHHKIHIFEHVNTKLVLMVQDKLLNDMSREFKFDHLRNPARIRGSMHLHTYRMNVQTDMLYKLSIQSRLSTDTDETGFCFWFQAEA